MTTPTPNPDQKQNELIEKLAEIEHIRWAHWQKWMHSKLTEEVRFEEGSHFKTGNKITSKEDFERWERQISTPYADLSEAEKQSDRDQVMRYWPIIEAELAKARLDENRISQRVWDGMPAVHPFAVRFLKLLDRQHELEAQLQLPAQEEGEKNAL